MQEEKKRIEFLRFDKEDSKLIDINKYLSDIRKLLNLSQLETFCYLEGNKTAEYGIEEELITKLREIVKEKKVYLKIKVYVKQKDVDVMKIELFNKSLNDKLNVYSSLKQLREKLDYSLKNEYFLFDDGKQINKEDENELTIGDILNNYGIQMTGEIKKASEETGKIELDHSARIEENLNLLTNSDKNIVFFGKVGHGKTTLTNLICGTNFENGNFKWSITKNVQFSKSRVDGDCIAIDFPGLKSIKEQLNHLELQKTTLSIIPVRMICFVVKYDVERYDPMIIDIDMMKQIFEDYKDNTVIIITHSEPLLQNIKNMSDTQKILETMTSYKSERIIFSYKGIDYESLFTKKLKPLMKEMKNIPKMIIKTKDIVNTIEIIGDEKFGETRNKFQEEFNKTLSKFETKFEEYRNNNDAKRALFFALKLYKNKHIRKYSKKIRSFATDDSLFFMDKIICEILLYSQKIHNQFMNFIEPEKEKEEQKKNEVKKEIKKEIKKINIGLQISNQDINEEYNRFKECPHCGTIWFRYTGCSSVYCGKRGTEKEDKISGCFKNYFVELTQGQLIVQESQQLQFDRINDNELGQILKDNSEIKANIDHKNNLDLPVNNNLLTEDEKKENEKKRIQNKILLQPIGCGERFDWNTANDVTDTVIEILGSDLRHNFTDYYSDVFEIKRELKVKSYVSEIKDKLRALNKKSQLIYEEKIEKAKIENIIEKFEQYEKLKNEERENLDEIKENSSTMKNEQYDTKNKRLKIFEEITKLLKEIGYQVIY